MVIWSFYISFIVSLDVAQWYYSNSYILNIIKKHACANIWTTPCLLDRAYEAIWPPNITFQRGFITVGKLKKIIPFVLK